MTLTGRGIRLANRAHRSGAGQPGREGGGESRRPMALVSRESRETWAPKDRATTSRSAASCTCPRLSRTRLHRSTLTVPSAPARATTAACARAERGKGSTAPATQAATTVRISIPRRRDTPVSLICAVMSPESTRQSTAASRAGHTAVDTHPPPARSTGSAPVTAPIATAMTYSVRATGTRRLPRSPGIGSHQAASWGRRKSGPSRLSGPIPSASSIIVRASTSHPGSRSSAPSPVASWLDDEGRAATSRLR